MTFESFCYFYDKAMILLLFSIFGDFSLWLCTNSHDMIDYWIAVHSFIQIICVAIQSCWSWFLKWSSLIIWRHKSSYKNAKFLFKFADFRRNPCKNLNTIQRKNYLQDNNMTIITDMHSQGKYVYIIIKMNNIFMCAYACIQNRKQYLPYKKFM